MLINGIKRERRGNALLLRFSLPPYNAMIREMSTELVSALIGAESDLSISAVVLAGEGKYFSVGADLSSGDQSMRTLLAEDGAVESDWQEPAGRVTRQMMRMSVPVVAAINGDAIGGGATMSLGADLRIMAQGARLGFPFPLRGITPEGGSTFLLPEIVGRGRASELLLSGRLIDATECLAIGLVAEVVNDGMETIERALEIVESWNHASPSAVATTKSLMNRASLAQLEAAIVAESDALRSASNHPDSVEGIRSFLERRPARFQTRTATNQTPSS